ncbi:MFS transporter [Planctomycetes bacterium K23_9]|uniref:Putative MFS-type transporter YhjX n=1 Tax=Stieleria marina TaxID=1930275 RepID=A0A517P2P4_9BACT|nr:putative MFS-type transporter YhjX [Planctomycetes bacterium K23_9]
MINAVSNCVASRLPFFYGYLIIPITMLMQICTSPGQTFAVSAFTPSLRESLQLSDSRLSLAYMIGTMLAALPLSFVGPFSDRWGIRKVTVFVTIALALTCWFASHVNGFASLLLAFFLLRFLGQGSMSLLSSNAIAMWYRHRIGRVSAVMSVGGAIAFAWVPEWLETSIANFGWRQTYVGLSIIVSALLLPAMILLFRNRPEEVGQHVDGISPELSQESQPMDDSSTSSPTERTWKLSDALSHPSIYILGLVQCCLALTGTGVVFYLFTLCSDRGMPSGVAADLFKTLGLSMLVAQLVGGVLADWLPLNRMLCAGTLMLAVGLGFAWLGDSSLQLHAFAAFFGAGQGLSLAVGAVVWVRYYGREHLGSIRGTVLCLTIAGSGCGPLIMGVVRDRLQTFDEALALFFFVMLTLSVLSWWATAPRLLAARDAG